MSSNFQSKFLLPLVGYLDISYLNFPVCSFLKVGFYFVFFFWGRDTIILNSHYFSFANVLQRFNTYSKDIKSTVSYA